MKNLRLAPLGCALLLALAAPVHAWSVQDKSGNTQIKLTDDGKLGVGMTPPSGSSAKLEVAGQVKITGGSPGAGKVLTSDGNGLASWQYPPGFWPAGYVSQGGLIWTPNTIGSVSFGGDFNNWGFPGGYANWTNANAYCTNTTINGLTGWRMPTKGELASLYNSGALAGAQGWRLGNTWSFTPHGVGIHEYFNLNNGYANWTYDADDMYVSCVR